MGTTDKKKGTDAVSLSDLENEGKVTDSALIEQTMHYEKRVYDLEQLLDIAKSLCSTLDFSNLLESIVYICMAQMHVLGAEIFVRDFISEKSFDLETSRDAENPENIVSISADSV